VILVKAFESVRYQYKHIKIIVLEKTADDKVLAFAAVFIEAKLPGETISRGLMEINRTLWTDDSSKRPKGYWNLGSFWAAPWQGCFMVSEEWLKFDKSVRKSQEERWHQYEWLNI
jgi:hypothetical protein